MGYSGNNLTSKAFMLVLVLVAALQAGGVATIVTSANNGNQPPADSIATCGTSKIALRLPPSLRSSRDHQRPSSYKPMPRGWLYGNWKVTYSSQPTYQLLLNLQWDPSPVFPQSNMFPGQNNDLSSFQLSGSDTIHTAYGVDTPRTSNDKTLGPEWVDVYDFVGTGGLRSVNNSIEVLGWGYDTAGIPYLVLYETPVEATGAPADIDIESKSDTGPSKQTLDAIFKALLALGVDEITQLTKQTVPLVQNGARRGEGPVVCDVTCVDNANLS